MMLTHEMAAPSTVEALMYELREGGLAVLLTSGCQRRLAALSSEQVLDVIARLSAIQSKHPAITADLLQAIRRAAL